MKIDKNSLTERTFTFALSPFCHSESCPELVSGSLTAEGRLAPKVNLPLCERGIEGDFNTINRGHPERSAIVLQDLWREGSLYSSAHHSHISF